MMKNVIFKNTAIFVIMWIKWVIFLVMGVFLIFKLEVKLVIRFMIVLLLYLIIIFL